MRHLPQPTTYAVYSFAQMDRHLLSFEDISNLLPGKWTSAENGCNWYFVVNNGESYSACFVKQNEPSVSPVQLLYKILKGSDHFYLNIEGAECKVVSISEAELILESTNSMRLKLTKNINSVYAG